jgi:lysophospholipase L1-like esterase
MGKKTVVCLGDSLTRGRVSFDYVSLLAQTQEGCSFLNAGVNRELSYNVLQRTEAVIRSRPDAITLLVGTNDANASLDPDYARRAMKRMNLPRVPDPGWFQENLFELVSRLQAGTDAELALLSIPPIGEELEHRSVKRAGEYSRIIRRVAETTRVHYLPLYETMIDELKENPGNPRTTYDRWRFVVYKSLLMRRVFRRSLDSISEANGFRLLVDFIHLNGRGGRIVAELIQGFLSRALNPELKTAFPP